MTASQFAQSICLTKVLSHHKYLELNISVVAYYKCIGAHFQNGQTKYPLTEAKPWTQQ